MKTEVIKILCRHGVSVREFKVMKKKYYFAKTKANNLIYLDGFIEKHK